MLYQNLYMTLPISVSIISVLVVPILSLYYPRLPSIYIYPHIAYWINSTFYSCSILIVIDRTILSVFYFIFSHIYSLKLGYSLKCTFQCAILLKARAIRFWNMPLKFFSRFWLNDMIGWFVPRKFWRFFIFQTTLRALIISTVSEIFVYELKCTITLSKMQLESSKLIQIKDTNCMQILMSKFEWIPWCLMLFLLLIR